MMLPLHQIILQNLEKHFLIYNKIMTIDDQIRESEKLPKYQPFHMEK